MVLHQAVARAQQGKAAAAAGRSCQVTYPQGQVPPRLAASGPPTACAAFYAGATRLSGGGSNWGGGSVAA